MALTEKSSKRHRFWRLPRPKVDLMPPARAGYPVWSGSSEPLSPPSQTPASNPLRCQKLHQGRAGGFGAVGAGLVDGGAGTGQIDAAQQRLDRADRGRAHRQAAQADGGQGQRLDRAACVLPQKESLVPKGAQRATICSRKVRKVRFSTS